MIAVEHLVTLSAVRRTGSIGGAAAELGYTPSAVSQQVKRLERRVGGAVLDRVGRGVVGAHGQHVGPGHGRGRGGVVADPEPLLVGRPAGAVDLDKASPATGPAAAPTQRAGD